MTNAKTYSLYGLNISSSLPCMDLPAGNGKVDVAIHCKPIPNLTVNWKQEGVCYKSAPGKYLLTLKGIATYFVSNGNEITIEKDSNAEDNAVRLFLFNPVFGALLMQRGILPLQGSGIIYNGECISFLGKSSAGKSIIAAAFRKRGYQVITDTICAVSLTENNKPVISPGYPYLMLWQNGLKKLDEACRNLKAARKGLQKYLLPLNKSFSNKPAPINRVYVLMPHNKNEYEIIKHKGHKKIFALRNNIYHKNLINGMDNKVEYFKRIAAIAECIPLNKVRFPIEKTSSPERLAEFIEKDFT